MAEMFYEKNGVSVSDTVFNNGNGGQFPIRNITSVEIKYLQPSSFFGKFIGGFFLLVGAVITISSKDITFGVVLIILGVVTAGVAEYFAKQKSTVLLFIGGGGTPQSAISLPLMDPNSKPELDAIANAINISIANLQKT